MGIISHVLHILIEFLNKDLLKSQCKSQNHNVNHKVEINHKKIAGKPNILKCTVYY